MVTIKKLEIKVEKATAKDAAGIKKLIDYYANKDDILQRSIAEIYENIRDYHVIRKDNEVVACVGLHFLLGDLAEIKSLCVKEEYKKNGYGRALMESCLREAQDLGAKQVFAFTFLTDFFAKFSFKTVSRDSLPKVVWGESVRCPKFPNCDCIAVVKEF